MGKKVNFILAQGFSINFIIARIITFKNIGEEVKITGTAQNSSSESSSVSSSDSSSLSSSTKPATLRSFKIFWMIDGFGQRCLFAFKKRSIFSESGLIFFLVADMISFAWLNNLSHIFDVGDTCFTDLYSDSSSLDLFFWAEPLRIWSAYPRSFAGLPGLLILFFIFFFINNSTLIYRKQSKQANKQTTPLLCYIASPTLMIWSQISNTKSFQNRASQLPTALGW